MERKIHALQKLEGELARGFGIRVRMKQLKKVEQTFFSVFIVDSSGRESDNPVFEGIYSSGIEPYIDGWIDGHYYEEAAFGGRRIKLSETGLDLKLFEKVGRTLRPSWSFMVAYESFEKAGKTITETSQGLNCGIPPVATPLGYLLFSTGRLKIKDWYFPEGGNEGMPKLEGIGFMDRKHAARMKKETVKEVSLFLKNGKCQNKELEVPAKRRAERVLQEIKNRV
jgi:hypothetical protein